MGGQGEAPLHRGWVSAAMGSAPVRANANEPWPRRPLLHCVLPAAGILLGEAEGDGTPAEL
jgi:hypothetical protein